MKVYGALWATKYLPKFAGAAPYDLSRGSIRFSRFGQLWSLLQLTIAATIFYLFPVKKIFDFNNIDGWLKTFTMWLQFFTAIYSVLKDGFCQDAMIDVIRSIDHYDEKMDYNNDHTGSQKNERVRFWSFFYTSLLIILAICRYSAWSILQLEPITEIFVMEIDNSINMFVVLTFLLGLRLRHLNTMIEQDRSLKVQTSGSETVGNHEYVRVLYSNLVKSGDRLNDHYASRLFVWVTQILIAIIRRSYDIVTNHVSALNVAVIIIQLLPGIIGILAVSLACEFTSFQINKTPAVLLEKNIRCTALIDRGRKEIFTLSLYMGLQPFEFSALGFFTVDLKLLYAVVGVTSTYLILCVQAPFK